MKVFSVTLQLHHENEEKIRIVSHLYFVLLRWANFILIPFLYFYVSYRERPLKIREERETTANFNVDKVQVFWGQR